MKIITIHGIRKRREWYKEFENLNIFKNLIIKFYHFEYGYFSFLSFIWPPSREKIYKKFLSFYEDIVQENEAHVKNDKPPSILCHSFGTYVFFNIISKYDTVKFDRVILCGSIITPIFNWNKFFQQKQLRIVFNHYGKQDWVVKFASLFLGSKSGPSGEIGFQNPVKSKYNEYFIQKKEEEFKHSDFFLSLHMHKYWAEFFLKSYNPFNYDDKILRPEIIERASMGGNCDQLFDRLNCFARIDREGNYFAHYSKEGTHLDESQSLKFIDIITSADALVDFKEMDFSARDERGCTLYFEVIKDELQRKLIRIYFESPCLYDQSFHVDYSFVWKKTMNLSLGDTDYFYISCYKDVTVDLNFSDRVNSPCFYIVREQVIIEEVAPGETNEIDGSITYRFQTTNTEKECDALIFYYTGHANKKKRSHNQPKVYFGSQFGAQGINISKCNESDIRTVNRIEYDIELGNAATEQTLFQRLSMFNDGFLVAKNTQGDLLGYIESVVWVDFKFVTFDEISNFQKYYKPNGNTLYVIFLATSKEYRKQGVATSLLQAIEEVAIKYKVNRIKLVAKDDLRKFYQKAGFKELHELPDFLTNTNHQCVLMEKQINLDVSLD